MGLRIIIRTQTILLSLLFAILAIAGCSGGGASSGGSPSAQAPGTPGAEQTVGERLFLETRFAQAFKVFLDNGGNVNDPNAGDAGVDTVETVGAPIDPGPFNGLSMNCRACHMVDDVLTAPGGGMRTYADFARRSPIPVRADGKTHAPRNSPALVNSTIGSNRWGSVPFRCRIQLDGRFGRGHIHRQELRMAPR